ADGRAALDQSRAELVFALDLGAWVVDVGEHRGGPAEHSVFQGHAFVDRDIVLDLAAVADRYVRAGHDILAERAISPDAGARQDVCEMPDACPLADFAGLVDISRLMQLNTRVRCRFSGR